MENDLSLHFLRVVEQAAIACAHTMGFGDRHGSDRVAVEAMRRVMDDLPMDDILAATRRDKKVVNGRLHFVLASGIGSTVTAEAHSPRAGGSVTFASV